MTDTTRFPWPNPVTASQKRFDRVLAAILLVCTILSLALYGQANVYPEGRLDMAPSLLWAVFIAVPLAWRREYPEIVLLVIAAAFGTGGALQVPELLMCNVTLFLAIHAVGAYSRNRDRARWLRLGVIAAMFVWLVVVLFQQSTNPDLLEQFNGAGALSPLVAFLLIQILTNLLYFGGAYFLGDTAWRAREERDALEASEAALRAERELTAQQAVELERLRLARELHDVVAHHVSLIGVQAGAARLGLAPEQRGTAQALTGIEAESRLAVTELHALLDTLRDADAGADAPSVIRLRALDDLVEQSRRGGLPTRLSVIGVAREVPELHALTLFRVAQESLTNARKYGGPTATADVRLRYLTGAVEIEITNSGSMARTHRDGFGQIGMAERVRACGGTIEFGPLERGGYLVRAHLPVVDLPDAGVSA